MKFFRALTSTKPEARVSWKVLLYAVLCTLFGTACLYCCIYLMFLNGFGVDEGIGEHPYDQAAMAISLLVAFALLCFSLALWYCTLLGASRNRLHVLITAAVAIVGFCPSFLLMGVICDLGEQIGQLILYD
jgi:hypothetical protein